MLEFDGKIEFDGNSEKFLKWLRVIEDIFDYEEYNDRRRFKLAVHQFTGRAYLWYEELEARRRREGKEKIQSWNKLKYYMKRKYLPNKYEQERLFLDTRDPPKPTTIERSDPYISSFAAFEKKMEKFLKNYKEPQEAKEAAIRAQQQEDELVRESNPTSTIPMSKEVKHDPKEQQHTSKEVTFVYNNTLYEENNNQEPNSPVTQVVSSEPSECNHIPSTPKSMEISQGQEKEQPVAELAQLDIVKSPTTPQIAAVQEDSKQPLVLLDQTDLFAVLREHCVHKESRPILFQEREDRVQEKHDGTQGKKQRSYKRRSYTAALYFECMFIILLITILTSWNLHARSGLKLLIYDSRTNLFKKGSLMREHKQNRQASIKPRP